MVLVNNSQIFEENCVFSTEIAKKCEIEQSSLPFYDYRLLEEMYVFGYKSLVLKILVQIKKIVEQAESEHLHGGYDPFIGFSIETIVGEIDQIVK